MPDLQNGTMSFRRRNVVLVVYCVDGVPRILLIRLRREARRLLLLGLSLAVFTSRAMNSAAHRVGPTVGSVMVRYGGLAPRLPTRNHSGAIGCRPTGIGQWIFQPPH